MKTTKILTLAVASSAFFAVTAQASAQTLMPSLSAQMQYQSEIDRENISSRTAISNNHALETIRLRNQARIQEDNSPAENIISAPSITNFSFAENISENKKAENIPSETRNIGNIDMARVEREWLSWVNALRKENGLAPYQANSKLSATAQEWAEFSKNRGYTTHGRPGDGCTGEKNYSCYNYKAIDEWFKARGVYASNVNRSTHTENVGYGAFKCSDGECTDEAIKAIRKTFDFFHREKSYNGVHYRSMVNSNFTEMGLGVAVKNGTYYLTAHYSTPLK